MNIKLTAEVVRDYPWGVIPKDGKMYIEIDSCCPECLEEGLQPGHFACCAENVPCGGRVIARNLDFHGGWKALVEV